ncbi:MAG: CrcB family protein [Halovenus sp.]
MSELSTPRRTALALIAVGGVAGGVARHSVAVVLPAAFPVGTLVANVLGTFLLGVVVFDQRLANSLTPSTRLLIATGFCSSFTTYSTFAAETSSLGPRLATLNVAVTYGLALGAVLLGRQVARWSA